MAKNRICELLGIRYPIIQAPMNWVSGAELAAAVSTAGGLGTLGPNAGAEEVVTDVDLTGEQMRAQIQRVRTLTRAPFAVNIAIGFPDQKYSKKMVEVVIEEAVPVAIVSVGPPNVYTKVLKDAGIKVLHAISTARHAQKAEEIGVDAVICEGYEAGGHKGFTELTTLVLTPLVAEAVTVPVVAGGGIGDARGVLAALVLGADAAYMGTRFMMTRESESHPRVKEALARARDVCTVSVPKDYMLARDLANGFTTKYLELKKAGAPEEETNRLLVHAQYRAQHLGQADEAEICCGQVAGLIPQLEGAGDVMAEMVKGLGTRFEELKQKLAGFL